VWRGREEAETEVERRGEGGSGFKDTGEEKKRER
jgi:hypothetical protein